MGRNGRDDKLLVILLSTAPEERRAEQSSLNSQMEAAVFSSHQGSRYNSYRPVPVH